MEKPDGDFLKNIEHQEQGDEDKGPVECRPDQSPRLVPFAEVHRVSDAHEFGADQRLGGGETEWREGNVLRLENCVFEIGERAETYKEVSRDDEELPHLIDYFSLTVDFEIASAVMSIPPAAIERAFK